MKVIAIFITLFAVSLAAPSEVASAEDKVIVVEKPKEDVKKEEEPLNVAPEEDKAEDKVEDASLAEVAEKPDEKPPVIVVATSVEAEKSDEEKVTDEEKEKDHRETSAVCLASTGATQAQITAIGENPSDDAPTEVKCYVKCLAEAYGAVKDDVVQKDFLVRNRPSTLTDDEFDAVSEACDDLKTDDPCDSAYLRYSCYFRQSGSKIRIV